MKIFKEIDPSDYYLIGVDTASSIDNCYSAIEVYSFRDFEQVGELAIRLGSLRQYSEIVLAVAEYFSKRANNRIILCIENNSIGKPIVEDVVDSDYVYNLYHDKSKVDSRGIVTEWGIATTGKTKPIMVAEAYAHINEHPEKFHSQELVNQLNSIERNNAGQVTSGSYTDMFMATCFCAYVRKMRGLEILPQLSYDYEEHLEQNISTVRGLIHAISPIQYTKEEIEKEDVLESNRIKGVEEVYIPPEEEEIFHLPFFFK